VAVSGGGDSYKVVVHQARSDNSFVGCETSANRQVHIIPVEHAERVGQGDVERNVGITRAESIHQRQKDGFPKADYGAYAQLAYGARLVLADRLIRGFQLRKYMAHLRIIVLANFG
jgi:hypothetical protein